MSQVLIYEGPSEINAHQMPFKRNFYSLFYNIVDIWLKYSFTE